MKTRLMALFIGTALLLPLFGCSAMLDREYVMETPHSEPSPGTTFVLRADNYESLVAAIRQLVSDGTEHGIIHLYNYNGSVDKGLAAACLAVKQKDPLGAYAVDYLTHSYIRIASYYEVDIEITYRRTREQIRSIVSAADSSAVREVLKNALSQYSASATMRIRSFPENEACIRALLEDAYYDTPAAAFGLPACSISLYPDSGKERVVEIQFTYSAARQTLLEREKRLEVAASDLTAGASATASERDAAAMLYERLAQRIAYTGERAQNNTAYDALFDRSSDSCGIALAFKLLCDKAGLDCVVVRGTLNGTKWFWNMVKTDGCYSHADAAAGILSGKTGLVLASDQEMRGYSWNGALYPSCTKPADASSGG